MPRKNHTAFHQALANALEPKEKFVLQNAITTSLIFKPRKKEQPNTPVKTISPKRLLRMIARHETRRKAFDKPRQPTQETRAGIEKRKAMLAGYLQTLEGIKRKVIEAERLANGENA